GFESIEANTEEFKNASKVRNVRSNNHRATIDYKEHMTSKNNTIFSKRVRKDFDKSKITI
ncbi:hypothetical protein COBT_002852, partial [Conglomerata obtusa]